MDTEMVGLIQSVGFPIVVTLWFMYRTDRIIRENTAATTSLIIAIENIKCPEIAFKKK